MKAPDAGSPVERIRRILLLLLAKFRQRSRSCLKPQAELIGCGK